MILAIISSWISTITKQSSQNHICYTPATPPKLFTMKTWMRLSKLLYTVSITFFCIHGFTNSLLVYLEKKWNIPLDLKKEDKVCDNCAKQAATMMLEKRMTSEQNSIDVFGKLKKVA
jgi:hypothetical protein